MASPRIDMRLLTLMKLEFSEGRRFKELEERTEIKAEKWKSFSLGRQRPTVEMLEKICTLLPHHAFWLMTGIDDSEFGHSAPDGCGFPEYAKKIMATKSHLEMQVLVGIKADIFISDNYSAENFTNKDAVENVRIYDQIKRSFFIDDFSTGEEKRMPLDGRSEEIRQENLSIRVMETVLENITFLKNKNLEFSVIEQIIKNLTRNRKAHDIKFDVLEKAHKIRDNALSFLNMMKKIDADPNKIYDDGFAK